jgi:hypothetical protein
MLDLAFGTVLSVRHHSYAESRCQFSRTGELHHIQWAQRRVLASLPWYKGVVDSHICEQKKREQHWNIVYSTNEHVAATDLCIQRGSIRIIHVYQPSRPDRQNLIHLERAQKLLASRGNKEANLIGDSTRTIRYGACSSDRQTPAENASRNH